MSARPSIHPHGYWAGADAHLHHACSRPLAEWIAGYLDRRRRTYDFGCGVGAYLAVLRDFGFKHLTGFEGEPPTHRRFGPIVAQDLTRPMRPVTPGNVISLEVAEHIPAEYEATYLDNVTGFCARDLVLSWAVRGQGGDGHVNCRDNEEVVELLRARGFRYLLRPSAQARAVITDLPWFRNTILVFARGR